MSFPNLSIKENNLENTQEISSTNAPTPILPLVTIQDGEDVDTKTILEVNFNDFSTDFDPFRLRKESKSKFYYQIPASLSQRIPMTRRNDDAFCQLSYTCLTCDTTELAEEMSTLRFTGPIELLVAVTIQQENQASLCRTLHGIMENLSYLENKWSKDAWRKVVVCLVADESTKQECLDLLTGIGVFQESLKRFHLKGVLTKAHLFEITTQVGVNSKGDIIDARHSNIIPCQFMFCLTEAYSDKRCSHQWIFEAFAPLLNPKICVLLNVGAKPEEKSFFQLWSAFEADPKLGGAFGKVEIESNGISSLNPLVAAQILELELSNTIDKPFESSLGYVTPSQGGLFCAYRWISLRNDCCGNGPLALYFNQGSRFLASIARLAEDHIISFGLISKRGEDWSLRQVDSAKCNISPEGTVFGFIRIRRKQFNASLFAVIYSCCFFYRILFTSQGFLRILALFLQFLLNFVGFCYSWFMLGNLYYIFRYIVQSAVAPGIGLFGAKAGPEVDQVFKFVYLTSLLIVLITSLGNANRGSNFIYTVTTISFGIIISYFFLCWFYLCLCSLRIFEEYSNDRYPEILRMVDDSIFLELLIVSVIYSGLVNFMLICYCSYFRFIKGIIQLLLLVPLYCNILSINAFCNIRGIRKPPMDMEGKKAKVISNRLFNWTFCTFWLTTNIVLVVLLTLYFPATLLELEDLKNRPKQKQSDGSEILFIDPRYLPNHYVSIWSWVFISLFIIKALTSIIYRIFSLFRKVKS